VRGDFGVIGIHPSKKLQQTGRAGDMPRWPNTWQRDHGSAILQIRPSRTCHFAARLAANMAKG